MTRLLCLLQASSASQINVAQNRLGLAGTSAGNGYAEQTKVASVKTPLEPVPDTGGVALADYQPLMATGLYLNGPPRRFSAKEITAKYRNPEFLIGGILILWCLSARRLAPGFFRRQSPHRFRHAQSSRLAEFGGRVMSFNVCRGTLGSLATFSISSLQTRRLSRPIGS